MMQKRMGVRLVLFKIMNGLRSISLKTQVRRLKYFSVFSQLLGRKGAIMHSFAIAVNNWVEIHRDDLRDYTSPTGEINPKNSNQRNKSVLIKKNVVTQSLKNYTEAAKSLGLIHQEKERLYPSYLLIILQNLNKNLNTEALKNQYNLHEVEKIFFLYTIIKYDADIFLCVYKMLCLEPELNLTKYQKKFQSYYIEYLEKKLRDDSNKNNQAIFEVYQRVNNWQKPKRYSESIVPPRLNWCIDLGLVNYFSEGEDRWIPLYEYEQIRKINSEHFFTEAINLFKIDNTRRWESVENNEKENLMFKYIQLARSLFGVLKLPRLPHQNTLLLLSFKLLQDHKIVAEPEQIGNWIGFERKINNLIIGIRKTGRTYESYIYLKNG